MTTLYAAIGTASDVVEGDYCDVNVTEAVVIGYKPGENDEEIELLGHGGASVLDPTELPIRTDDEDKLADIEQAAVDLLEVKGFRVTGPWELADNAAYAPVERIDEPSVEVVWSVVDGASPKAHAVEPGPIGVTFPASVQAWAERHGLADDNDTVYVMVTLADEAGPVDGEIARLTALASPADAELIFNALHTEVVLYEDNSDIVTIGRGPRGWSMGAAVPEMADTFSTDAHAWLEGSWEPNEGDGKTRQELGDDFTAVAAYNTEDGVRLLVDTDRIGAGARVYLGLPTTV